MSLNYIRQTYPCWHHREVGRQEGHPACKKTRLQTVSYEDDSKEKFSWCGPGSSMAITLWYTTTLLDACMGRYTLGDAS